MFVCVISNHLGLGHPPMGLVAQTDRQTQTTTQTLKLKYWGGLGADSVKTSMLPSWPINKKTNFKGSIRLIVMAYSNAWKICLTNKVVQHCASKRLKKIRETKHIWTDADSSTNTTVGWTKNTRKPNFFENQKIHPNRNYSKTSRNMPKIVIRPSTRGL